MSFPVLRTRNGKRRPPSLKGQESRLMSRQATPELDENLGLRKPSTQLYESRVIPNFLILSSCRPYLALANYFSLQLEKCCSILVALVQKPSR